VSDPLRIVWDALDQCGYGPHGQPHDFRSRCPGHDGDNRDALHVSAGAGGEALLWCFAHGCSPEEIVEPLVLRTRDLFPLDLHSGRRLRSARREDFTGNARTVANVLMALEALRVRWSIALWLDECPNCERQHAQLSIGSTGEPRVYCGRGCDADMVSQALADRLTDQRRRAA
jgi:hypothetical protein